ncbi:MAG: phosphoribosyltransferase family protein [Acidobacteriota bacterium]
MFTHALQNLRDGILTLAYPQECRVCKGQVESWRDGVVCHRCWENPHLTELFTRTSTCHKCDYPLPPVQQFAARTTDVTTIPAQPRQCGRCQKMPFTFARACGAYTGTLEANILFLKSTPHLCRRLREMLGQTYQANEAVLASEVIVPVPLHDLRKRERGFNQAEVVARALAWDYGLNLDTTALIRSKATERHRVGMDEVDRLKSVAKAFKVRDPQRLKARSILLIDDVFTTGSTIRVAAETLLNAGVVDVKALTLVRVIQRL